MAYGLGLCVGAEQIIDGELVDEFSFLGTLVMCDKNVARML